MDLLTIHPGTGVGDLRFGATRDEVRKIAGDPTEIVPGDNDDAAEMWIYESAALALSFAAEEGMRLVSCETFSMQASFNGETLIGLSREEAEAALERAGADDGMFDAGDDDEDEGALIVPRLDLHLWLADGVVESVGWGVLLDDDDNVVWPT